MGIERNHGHDASRQCECDWVRFRSDSESDPITVRFWPDYSRNLAELRAPVTATLATAIALDSNRNPVAVESDFESDRITVEIQHDSGCNRDHDCGCNSVEFWLQFDRDLVGPRLLSDRSLVPVVSQRCRAVGRVHERRRRAGAHELLTKRHQCNNCVYIYRENRSHPQLCAPR